MSRMLRIDEVDVPSWGRASGVALRLPGSGLVVLYGPNESGKTSLATALAWLIAGPGPPQLTRRFGHEGERLEARLRGQLGDERLIADAVVKVAGSRSRAARASLHASIGGTAVGRADLIAHLGGIDFDGYQRFHWVEALRVADGSNLQENVSVQAVFGGVNPFAEAKALDDEAKKCLGQSRGRAKSGTARDLHPRVLDLGRQMQNLLGARNEWARLEDEIERATAEREQHESRLEELNVGLRSLQLAIKAHGEGAVVARDEAARELAGTPASSAAERELHAQTTLASRRIGELGARESAVASAQQQSDKAEADVDPSWRPLIASREIGTQALEIAESAERHLKDLRSQVHVSEADRHSADERRRAAEGLRSELLEDWMRRAPKNLDPDDVPLPPEPGSGEPDSGAASSNNPSAAGASRSAVTVLAGMAALVTAAACLVVLALMPEARGGSIGWLIAGLGVLASGTAGVLAFRTRRLDPEVVHLARRYRDARGELKDAERGLRERQGELDAMRSRAEAARTDYRQNLRAPGVPDDMIDRYEPDSATHLRAVRNAQVARTELDRARQEAREQRRSVIDLFVDISAEGLAAAAVTGGMSEPGEPMPERCSPAIPSRKSPHVALTSEAFDATHAEALLDAVGKKVEAHRTANEAAREADRRLKAAVNYDEAALAHLESSTQEELRASEERIIAEVSELKKKRKETKNRTIGLEADKRRLESPEKTTAELLLSRNELESKLEGCLVRGLAHGLASTLLRDAAERHRTEQQPELLRRTAELACVASDWRGVTVNPHTQTASDSVGCEHLRVDGPRGEHTDRQLSLGAQTLLYLALRLATVERQAKSRGVRLPLILDDILIALDDERTERCLGILAEFSRHHQMILLTCHETTVQRAKAAGAAVLPVRGVQQEQDG